MTDFTPSEPIGKSEEPDSPFHDKSPSVDANASAVDATCTYKGSTYSKGAKICINKTQFECGNNGWFKNGKSC